jgi:hypothetical protein
LRSSAAAHTIPPKRANPVAPEEAAELHWSSTAVRLLIRIQREHAAVLACREHHSLAIRQRLQDRRIADIQIRSGILGKLSDLLAPPPQPPRNASFSWIW